MKSVEWMQRQLPHGDQINDYKPMKTSLCWNNYPRMKETSFESSGSKKACDSATTFASFQKARIQTRFNL